VGWGENSLTEWQREKTITINNTNKKNMQHSHHFMLSLLLSSNPLPSASSPLKYRAWPHMV